MATNDFLYNSDDNIDKVILYKETTISSGQSLSIPHGLGFIPLVFGVWSSTSDFTTCHPIGEIGNWAYVGVAANSTSVDLNYVGSGTVYVRIYGLMPTDQEGNAPNATSGVNGLIFSSDYNYTKLYMSGVTNSETGTSTISHNLGYKPQVMAWEENYNGTISPFSVSQFIIGNTAAGNVQDGMAITNSVLQFKRFPDDSRRFHYRIYYDESA